MWRCAAAANDPHLALWARGWPGSYDRLVTHPGWRRRIRRSVIRVWPALMEACGLPRRVIGRNGTELRVPGLSRPVAGPGRAGGRPAADGRPDRRRPRRPRRNGSGPRSAPDRSGSSPTPTHTGCTVRFLFADPLGGGGGGQVPFPEPGTHHHDSGDGCHRGRAAVADPDPGLHLDRRAAPARARRRRCGCCC